MYKLYLILIACFTLLACSVQTKSENIDKDILSQSEVFAQQLYNVINDVDSLKKIDIDKLSDFYNQDITYLNEDEQKLIETIEEMFNTSVAYQASYYAGMGSVNKETKQKLKQIKNTLENEYGINID